MERGSRAPGSDRETTIAVVGLGYVGAVCAACWAREGHRVIGVDVDAAKVATLAAGRAPMVEPGLQEIVADGVAAERLRATTDLADAVRHADVSMICVGTPSQANGALDLSHIEEVSRQLGAALRDRDGFHVVVVRSTVLPGTIAGVVIPLLEEHSGKRAGIDFGVASNPEFLRESTAIADFDDPPKTVIGATDTRSSDLLESLYAFSKAPLIQTRLEVAEMVKYADNAWHATKVSFANEIGNLAKAMGIDGHEVMDAFCRDRKLNISSAYLRPGFAFGGSCLPKDVRALRHQAGALDLPVPLLGSLLESNESQIERAYEMIRGHARERGLLDAGGHPRVGLLGLAFKAGTDDVRESPLVALVERLIGTGFEVRIFDPSLPTVSTTGEAAPHPLARSPHIAPRIRGRLATVVGTSDIVVVGTNDPAFQRLPEMLKPDQAVIDLVRLPFPEPPPSYSGICW